MPHSLQPRRPVRNSRCRDHAAAGSRRPASRCGRGRDQRRCERREHLHKHHSCRPWRGRWCCHHHRRRRYRGKTTRAHAASGVGKVGGGTAGRACDVRVGQLCGGRGGLPRQVWGGRRRVTSVALSGGVRGALFITSFDNCFVRARRQKVHAHSAASAPRCDRMLAVAPRLLAGGTACHHDWYEVTPPPSK